MGNSEISDIIVAICTIVLTYLTYKNVKVARDVLESTEKSSAELTRPYVIANVYSEDLHINLSIQNIGKRPAKDVSIIFTPSLDVITGKSTKGELNFDSTSLLNQVFIPPDFRTTTVIIENPQFFTLENRPDFKVLITYKDLNNIPYNEHYTISLKYLSTKKIAQFTNEYYFGRIAKSLENLTEVQKKK